MATNIELADTGATDVVLNQSGVLLPATTSGTAVYKCSNISLDANGNIVAVLNAQVQSPTDLGGLTLAEGNIIIFATAPTVTIT